MKKTVNYYEKKSNGAVYGTTVIIDTKKISEGEAIRKISEGISGVKKHEKNT